MLQLPNRKQQCEKQNKVQKRASLAMEDEKESILKIEIIDTLGIEGT